MQLPRALDTSLRTAVALVALPVALLLQSTRAIALALFGASPARVHACYVGFARTCLRVADTRLGVRGAEHAPAGGAYVVVSNHESAWDPVCLVAALPDVLLRFVVKRPIMRIPVFGQALRWTGNVTVVRTQTEADVQRLREGMARRAPGVSVGAGEAVGVSVQEAATVICTISASCVFNCACSAAWLAACSAACVC